MSTYLSISLSIYIYIYYLFSKNPTVKKDGTKRFDRKVR